MKLLSSTSWDNFPQSYLHNVVCARTGEVISWDGKSLRVGEARTKFPVSYHFANGDIPNVPNAAVFWEWDFAPGELRAACTEVLFDGEIIDAVGLCAEHKLAEVYVNAHQKLEFFEFKDKENTPRLGFYVLR
jgi:hypothetical protein